ncbi:MAG TPA: DMT family transporter [Actinophytocola sp.]|uniref:DMT family transporter n=1 Tax=Actinophytocola sp. TaxID=1872138 RepID=UPI002DDD60AD|nr:DMT family transporter [Actinophytocola sp.]HEV2782464.1 DMT family transporter [Actinophytocola sp.]
MRTHLTLVLVMALWGSAFASSKLAVNAIPHEVAAFLRFGLAAMILLAMHAALTRHATRPPPHDLGLAGGLGILGVFGYNVLFFLALSLAPSADGSVIVPVLSPVITVAVTALLGRRGLSARTVLGLAAAVAGAGVFFAGIPAGGDHRLLGDLLYVAAAGCWSAYTVCGAPVLARLPALTVTAYATLAGALALGVVALPAVADVEWSTLDIGFWLNQAYLAVLPTAVAYVLYYRAVRRAGPATAASAMFLVPVFGLACAWLLLGESITAVQAAGSVLMLAGAWLATTTPGRTASIQPAWLRSRGTSRSAAAATDSAPSRFPSTPRR